MERRKRQGETEAPEAEGKLKEAGGAKEAEGAKEAGRPEKAGEPRKTGKPGRETASTVRCIGVLNRCFKQYSEQELEPYGLTHGLYLYLLYICHNPGCSLVNLRDRLDVDKGYVTRAVGKLCGLGYIRKEQREEDQRSYCLFLTEAGERLMEVIRDVPRRWNEAAESGLEPGEREELNRLLNKMCRQAAHLKDAQPAGTD